MVKDTEFRLVTNGSSQPLCQTHDVSWKTAATSTTALTTGTFQHVACTFDYDTGTLQIYVNGVNTGTQTGLNGFENAATSWQFGNDAGGTYGDYSGVMDDTRIYNRALSSHEIATLYSGTTTSNPPIAHWSLDENTGSTANDTSGNENHGTLGASTGAPVWVPGKNGSSLDFDGSNDYVSGGSSSTLDDAMQTGMTFSAWIKPTIGTNWYVIASKIANANPTNPGWLIEVTPSNDGLNPNALHIHIGGSSGNLSMFSSANTITSGVWQHVAFTTTGSLATSTVKMYVNGRETTYGTQSSGSGSILSDAAQTFAIGCDAVQTSGECFDGSIDEVKVYNYTRTQSQIIEDMNGSAVPVPTSHWKMDDMSGTTAQDQSSNNNDLTLSSASWTSGGKFGGAWNGTGSIWLSRTEDPDLDFATSESFSFSTWVKSDSDINPGASQFILAKQTATNNPGYRMYFNTSGQIVCDIDDDTTSYPEDTATTTADFYDGTWHHVICSRDIVQDKLLIFVDGILREHDSNLSATGSLDNAATFYLGDDDGDATNSFAGDIDEPKVYRVALTVDQVKVEYNAGQAATFGSLSTASNGIAPDNSTAREYCIPGDTSTCNTPVGEWKFDEGLGTSAADTSGNGFTGTATAGTTWLPGKFGSGIGTDGTHEVAMSTSSTLDMGSSDLSISFWAKIPSANTDEFIDFAMKGATGTTTEGYWFFWRKSTGYLSFRISDGVSRISNDCTMTPTIEDDKWHFITATADRDGSSSIYVDGVFKCSTSISSFNGVSIDNTGETFILNETDVGTGVTVVDNLRVYKYLRTPAQIAWEYNQGAPIAHYKLDECSGTTAYNSVETANGDAAGNNGTITIGGTGSNTSTGTCSSGTSTEAWNNGTTGKLGASLSFDGTNDYVTIADNSALDLSTELSITAWIKRDTNAENDIVSKWTPSGNQRSYIFGMYDVDTEELRLTLSNDGSNVAYTARSTNANLSTNTWYHVTVIWDTTTDTTRMYVNGIQVSTAVTIGSSPATIFNGSGVLNIGAENAGTQQFFDGQIDDVQIFNYALTPTQVKTVMNAGGVRFD